MKKVLALVLVLALALSATSAFAVKSPYVEKDYSQLPKYHYLWTQYFVTPTAEDAYTIKLIEDTFNVDIEVPNIEDGNFLEVLNTYIIADNTPDVIRLKDPSQFNTYVDQEAIGSFDMELVKEYFPIYYNGMMDYQDGLFLSYGSVDGVQYGLPTLSTGNLFHLPVVYNETWMKKVGVEKTPETLDELHDLLYKFTYEDPDGDGVQNTYGISSDGMRNVFGAFGVNPGAADGRTDHSAFQYLDDDHDGTEEFVYAATSQRYKEALKVLKAWYDEGLIDPEFITGENSGGYWAISHSFVNHRIGSTVRANYYHWVSKGDYQYIDENGEWADVDSGAVATEFYNANPDEHIIFGDPVVGPYGDSGVKSWNLLAQIYCFSPELTADTDRFIRALEIMNFCARNSTGDPEIIEQYVKDFYGEEGGWWYWKNKETGSWGTTQAYSEEFPDFEAINRYGRTEYGPSAPREGTDEGSAFARSLGYKEHGINTLLQFSLPMMAEYQTNLTNLKDNWMVQFITGQKDIDGDWDAYLKEMDASGLSLMFNEAKDYFDSTQ